MTADYRSATVIDALLDSAARNPDGLAFRVVERSGEEFELSYADTCRMAGRTAAGLAANGLDEAGRVVVVMPTSRDFLATYLGCLYAGVVPIITAEPTESRIDNYAANLRGLVEHCQATRVIASRDWEATLAPLLPVPVVTPGTLNGAPADPGPPRARASSLAHLQATSGSTGSPKVARIRHCNLVANVHAIEAAIEGDAGDSLVSWLPMFHDMGLVGISYALYGRIPMIISDPINFLRNPITWLHWISRYRGTLSPAPNAAFHMCARVAKRRPPEDLDLSSWRVALCGAEPVRESTMAEFQAAFGRFGLSETTLRPVYGLAEATLAVAISETTRPYAVDLVDPGALAAKGRAEPRPAADPCATSVMCVGAVLPGHHLRVVDEDGEPLPERVIGEIEVCGPSVIDGYLPKPGEPPGTDDNDAGDGQDDGEFTRPDGYLRTGDLGYQADGNLYVTGRRKDIIIIAGRNYIPEQLEAFVENMTDIRRASAVVAVGIVDPLVQTEQLHLLLDTRIAEGRDRRAVSDRISDALAEAFGIGGVSHHWVSRAQLPRTTSGKIQRHLCRRLIEERLAASRRAA